MDNDELSFDELDNVSAGLESLESRLGKLIYEYNKISNPNDKRKVELGILIHELNNEYEKMKPSKGHSRG
jgi:hypothetical protein